MRRAYSLCGAYYILACLYGLQYALRTPLLQPQAKRQNFAPVPQLRLDRPNETVTLARAYDSLSPKVHSDTGPGTGVHTTFGNCEKAARSIANRWSFRHHNITVACPEPTSTSPQHHCWLHKAGDSDAAECAWTGFASQLYTRCMGRQCGEEPQTNGTKRSHLPALAATYTAYCSPTFHPRCASILCCYRTPLRKTDVQTCLRLTSLRENRIAKVVCSLMWHISG